MWDEPTNPNGVITSYNVTVYQTDGSNDVIFSDIAVTATTVTESVMALPYTNYTVAVTASTSAGEGEEESVIETSPQAGTYTAFSFLIHSKCTTVCTHAVVKKLISQVINKPAGPIKFPLLKSYNL